jgi:hypothetical protein
MDLGLTLEFSIMSHFNLKFWRIKVYGFWGTLKERSLGFKVFRVNKYGTLKV